MPVFVLRYFPLCTVRTISHFSQCSTTGVTKGCGMYYHVRGMMHIKDALLVIGKSSPYGGSGFPLSLSEWSFTICPTQITANEMCCVRR